MDGRLVGRNLPCLFAYFRERQDLLPFTTQVDENPDRSAPHLYPSKVMFYNWLLNIFHWIKLPTSSSVERGMQCADSLPLPGILVLARLDRKMQSAARWMMTDRPLFNPPSAKL